MASFGPLSFPFNFSIGLLIFFFQKNYAKKKKSAGVMILLAMNL